MREQLYKYLVNFLLLAFMALHGISASQKARAEQKSVIYARFHSFDHFCNGDCAIAAYAGRSSGTDTFVAFGLNGFKPAWDWEWDEAYIGALAISRRLLTFGVRGLGDTVSVELEAGIGQRFGDLHETEVWIALYGRWTYFPWNHLIYTTVAASTGFSYATGIPDLERRNTDNLAGSRLMHFFSPEITFALPRYKHIEFLVRYHHRSGLFKADLFNRTTGGLNFLSAGFRVRF